MTKRSPLVTLAGPKATDPILLELDAADDRRIMSAAAIAKSTQRQASSSERKPSPNVK